MQQIGIEKGIVKTENEEVKTESTVASTENEDVRTENGNAAMESDNITEYTYSLEGLQFSDAEIADQRNAILDNMTPYLNSFLKALKQSDKEEIFIDQTSKYARNRMTELLTDNDFHFQSLLTYKDYVREWMLPLLKDKVLHRKANVVQGELMNYETLERILSEVVPADELTPDPAALAELQAAEQKATAKKKADKPAPVRSTIANASKQGYDLIAGFSVNKSNADRLCTQLKAKGCDAYIINRNGLYYVSMGSAASRTEIEAKYNHVKEWYKGDVSIKKL
jgi:cell division septation protein DedD